MDIMSSLGWYIAVVLPLFIFHEANDRLADFLKRKNIYQHWDSWHCALLLLVAVYVVLSYLGY